MMGWDSFAQHLDFVVGMGPRFACGMRDGVVISH